MTAQFNPKAQRVVLLGDQSLTIACADLLVAGGHRIAALVTQDADVRAWAEGQNVPVLEAPKDLPDAGLGEFDWLLSIANLRIIPKAALALPRKGAINFHDGPLPRYAGLNTPAWAIINGESEHGVSWHMIEGGVDEGDLLAQVLVPISPDETAFSLNSKCYAAGMESFADVLSQIEADAPKRMPQNLSKRSYFARDDRPKAFALLDFSKTTAEICALVRGLDFGGYANPMGVPKIAVEDQVFSVASAEPAQATGVAGLVIETTADGIVVAAADGAVLLRDIKTLSGEPAPLPGPGTLIASAEDRLDDLARQIAVDEPHWQRVLEKYAPVWAPLAAASPVAETTLETSLSPAQIAHAVGLAALFGAGQEAGYIALAKTSAAPGLIADCVPLAVTHDGVENFEKALNSSGMSADLNVRIPEVSDARPQVALSLDSADTAAAMCARLQGNTLHLRADEAALALWADRVKAALAHVESGAAGALSMPDAERARMLEDWNATGAPVPETTIHAAFVAQVAQTPDATALVFEGEALSYAELETAANQLAHVLQSMGAGPGVPVGLAVRRGTGLLIGALAILKAGSAYVPLDPAYPSDRIAHYISDSGAPIIVSQQDVAQSLPAGEAQVLLLDDPRITQSDTTPPRSTSGPDDLAYLIYTSGSTGTPKGVMVTHANVANFFTGMDAKIDHDAGAVWLAVTSLSFDISVLELFWTLSRGFKVVLAGDDSRTELARGPIAVSDKHMDFNLFYWGNDDGVGRAKYRLLLEGARFADQHGFNAIWTPERHFHAFGGPYPNPSVTGAAVAAVTRNLAVRAGSCVAPLHHPLRIAEEWAVIDNLTEGRVGLGMAAGWQPDDFVLRPENTPPNNKPALYEAIDQLRRLWRGETVAFPREGREDFQALTQPRPVSKELPIWVTTAGNPETWREAGEIGANVLTHLLGQSIEEVGEKITLYHEALRKAGHNPDDFTVTLMLHTYLADSRAEAEKVARGPMKDYLRSAAGLIKQYAWAFPAFKRPKGVNNAFDMDLEGLSGDELEAILDFAFERYFNESGMFGTVEDGLKRAEDLKRIGVTEIACLIDYGIAPDLVLEGLKPLAKVLERTNAGAELDADDFSLAAQIVRHKVTHMQCTPSMAQMLVTNEDARGALAGLKTLMVGGEALPGALAEALGKATRAKLINMYGPTETTIWSTTQDVGKTEAITPIGRPIANTQVYILDPAMAPCAAGVAGELYIGGDGVTAGYWKREEMTAERFVANPFGAGRLYRTGDLAAWRGDGALSFMGRADDQVKIRGHRIELGEIEAALSAQPGVDASVVVAREAAGGAQLVGYVVGTTAAQEDTLKRALAARLPDIMVPARIISIDAMPLTPNKKIDRKALPEPSVAVPQAATEAAPPQNDTQRAIASVWRRVLGVPNVRPSDNFFALGGHSLLAVQAHRDIRAELGLDRLSITDIFRFPTLEGLAAHVTGQDAPQSAPEPAAPAGPEKSATMSKRRAMRANRSKAGA